MRKVLKRKIWTVSLVGGALACVLAFLGGFLHRAISVSAELREKNEHTISRIICRDLGPAWTDASQGADRPICDITVIETDQAFESADYVLDRSNHFFIYNKGRLPGFWLDKSDVTFLRQFRQVKSVT